MRISDGSSDVCSSDLLLALAVVQAVPGRQPLAAYLLGLLAELSAAFVLAGSQRVRIELAAGQLAIQQFVPLAARCAQRLVEITQIGRASCRVRGCQYV